MTDADVMDVDVMGVDAMGVDAMGAEAMGDAMGVDGADAMGADAEGPEGSGCEARGKLSNARQFYNSERKIQQADLSISISLLKMEEYVTLTHAPNVPMRLPSVCCLTKTSIARYKQTPCQCPAGLRTPTSPW